MAKEQKPVDETNEEFIDLKPVTEEKSSFSDFDITLFFEKYRRIIIGAGVGILLLAGGIYYYYYSLDEKELEGRVEIIGAFNNFEKDSLDRALKGTSQTPGLEQIAEDYSGTPTGNQANYLAGMALLQKGKVDEAIEYLERFPKNGTYLSALAQAGLGTAHEEKNEPAEAAGYYEAAAAVGASGYTKAYFLKEAARCYEGAGENEKALKLYRQIKEKYPRSEEARSIEKYIYRLSAAE
jgi:tetratricopeptide (TPR) repeat protein